jgi:hypothetical protein
MSTQDWRTAFREALSTSLSGGSVAYKEATADLMSHVVAVGEDVAAATNGKAGSFTLLGERHTTDGTYWRLCVVDKATKEEHFCDYFVVGWNGYPIQTAQAAIRNVSELGWYFKSLAAVGTPFNRAIRCVMAKNGA